MMRTRRPPDQGRRHRRAPVRVDPASRPRSWRPPDVLVGLPHTVRAYRRPDLAAFAETTWGNGSTTVGGIASVLGDPRSGRRRHDRHPRRHQPAIAQPGADVGPDDRLRRHPRDGADHRGCRFRRAGRLPDDRRDLVDAHLRGDRRPPRRRRSGPSRSSSAPVWSPVCRRSCRSTWCRCAWPTWPHVWWSRSPTDSRAAPTTTTSGPSSNPSTWPIRPQGGGVRGRRHHRAHLLRFLRQRRTDAGRGYPRPDGRSAPALSSSSPPTWSTSLLFPKGSELGIEFRMSAGSEVVQDRRQRSLIADTASARDDHRGDRGRRRRADRHPAVLGRSEDLVDFTIAAPSLPDGDPGAAHPCRHPRRNRRHGVRGPDISRPDAA